MFIIFTPVALVFIHCKVVYKQRFEIPGTCSNLSSAPVLAARLRADLIFLEPRFYHLNVIIISMLHDYWEPFCEQQSFTQM